MRNLLVSDHHHVGPWRGAVEPLDIGLAALERATLVDVALVGDLVGVDRRGLVEEQHPRDPMGRAELSLL